MEEFSVTVFGSPASGTRVTLAGELDLAAADEFWTTLEPLLQPRVRLPGRQAEGARCQQVLARTRPSRA